MRYRSLQYLTVISILVALQAPAFAQTVKSCYSDRTFTTDREKIARINEIRKSDDCIGITKIDYEAAWNIRELLAKLFSYPTGCDRTWGHRSLLDCFASGEATSDCAIGDEVRRANDLHRQGQCLIEIQDQLNNEFATKYPFETATRVYAEYLKKYRLPAKHVELPAQ